MKILFHNFLILLFIFLISGCSNSEQNYKKAETINTIEAYRQFIEEYPNSDYAKLANDKIAGLSFAEAKKINSEEAYQKFIKDFPNTSFVQEAIDSASGIAYRNIGDRYEKEVFVNFLNVYPKSRYTDEMNKSVENIEHGHYVAKETSLFSKEKFKTMFHWNSNEKLVTETDNCQIKYVEHGMSLTGKWSLGNIIIDGPFDKIGNNFRLYKGTIIIFKAH